MFDVFVMTCDTICIQLIYCFAILVPFYSNWPTGVQKIIIFNAVWAILQFAMETAGINQFARLHLVLVTV